jgi:predicted nucleic acid binding AN1-type Zn finger protein
MSKKKELMKECSYHLCKYKGDDLHKCIHCGKFFCSKHMTAKPPFMPNFRSGSKENEDKMALYRLENAHPCGSYNEVEDYDDLVYIHKISNSDKTEAQRIKEARKYAKQQVPTEGEINSINNLNKNKKLKTCNYCDILLEKSYSCNLCGKSFCYNHCLPLDHYCAYKNNTHNSNNINNKSEKKYNYISKIKNFFKKFNIKSFKINKKVLWFFIWILIYSFSVFLMGKIIPLIGVTQDWIKVLLTGLGITLVAKIIRTLKNDENFVINTKIIYWTLLHSFSYWIMIFFLNTYYFSINEFLNYLIIGLGINIIVKIFGKIQLGSSIYRSNSNKMWFLILLSLGIYFFNINPSFLPNLISNPESLINNLNNNLSNYFCSDWTLMNTCSLNKPFYCNNGTLIENVSSCGCPYEKIAQGDKCISVYQVNPKSVNYPYMLKGASGSISSTVYKGLNDYLANLDRSYICYNYVCPPDIEIELREINNELQNEYLLDFVDLIKSKTTNKDDQARIAISLVQNIPYDYDSFYSRDLTGRYPYEVLYDKTGVCGEKSKLLAYLLKELGFGVALFSFDFESHMSVGIKCSSQYDYINSGYCFIEATTLSIITDSEGDYVGAGKLWSTPTIYPVSEGISMDVTQEYNDFQEWKRIANLGTILSHSDYAKWEALVAKYGIKIEGYN